MLNLFEKDRIVEELDLLCEKAQIQSFALLLLKYDFDEKQYRELMTVLMEVELKEVTLESLTEKIMEIRGIDVTEELLVLNQELTIELLEAMRAEGMFVEGANLLLQSKEL